jgi:hypothetical protein
MSHGLPNRGLKDLLPSLDSECTPSQLWTLMPVDRRMRE